MASLTMNSFDIIKNKIKKYLIVHVDDNATPRLLKIEVLSLFLALIAISQIVLFSSFGTKIISTIVPGYNGAAVLPAILAVETNEYRGENNVKELALSPLLAAAANMKAADMAKRSYFSHIGPDGEKPWEWIKKVGYGYTYAGENLAIQFTESRDVTNAWINSPTHRANLINEHFTETGIGTAEGIFDNKPTTFVVQFFATPDGRSYSQKIDTHFDTPAISTSTATVITTTSTSTSTTTPATLATNQTAPASTSTTEIFALSTTTTPKLHRNANILAITKKASSTRAFSATTTGVELSSKVATSTSSSTGEVLGLATTRATTTTTQTVEADTQTMDLHIDSQTPSDQQAATALAISPRSTAKRIASGIAITFLFILSISLLHTLWSHQSSALSARFAHTIRVHQTLLVRVFLFVVIIVGILLADTYVFTKPAQTPSDSDGSFINIL